MSPVHVPLRELPIGTSYGQLTLVAHVEPPPFVRKREAWGLWRCSCGREKKIRTTLVIGGRARSCGCTARRAMRGLINAGYAEMLARRRGR